MMSPTSYAFFKNQQYNASKRASDIEIQLRDTMLELTELRLQIESLQEQLEAKERENEELRGLVKC